MSELLLGSLPFSDAPYVLIVKPKLSTVLYVHRVSLG